MTRIGSRAKIARYRIRGVIATLGILRTLHRLTPIQKRAWSEVDTLQYFETKKPAPRIVKSKESQFVAVHTLRSDFLNLAPDSYNEMKLESLISKDNPTSIDSTATLGTD